MYCTGFTDDRGIVHLQTEIMEPGIPFLCVSAPNHESYSGALPADDVPAAHPRIVYLGAESALFGLGDGTIGSSGWFNLDIILENIGSRTAEDTEVKLTRIDPSVSILDSLCSVGDLPPRTSIIKDDAFTISLDSEIPPGQSISLELEITTQDGH